MKEFDLDEFELSVWCKPHKAYGYVKSLCFSDDNGSILASIQEQSDKVRPAGSTFEICGDQPFGERRVVGLDPQFVINLVRAIDYSPFQNYSFNRFGGSFFGVRVENGFDVVTYQWHGSVDCYNKSIVNVYKYIDQL